MPLTKDERLDIRKWIIAYLSGVNRNGNIPFHSWLNMIECLETVIRTARYVCTQTACVRLE